MTTGLSDFFRYNLWANLRLLDACEQLSDTQLDATPVEILRSVREILQHMLASEEGYAKHFTGETPLPPLKEVTTFLVSLNYDGGPSNQGKRLSLLRNRIINWRASSI